MRNVLSFKVLGKRVMCSLTIVDEPSRITGGMASRCADGLHVLFLDYDGITEEVLDEELEAGRDVFKTSEFYKFLTDKKHRLKWHAVCLDKFKIYPLYHKVIPFFSCDFAFKGGPRIYEWKSWVLRDFPKGEKDKPEFVGVIPSKYHLRKQSSAHSKYLELMYGIPITLAKPDGLMDLRFATYKTGVGLKQ